MSDPASRTDNLTHPDPNPNTTPGNHVLTTPSTPLAPTDTIPPPPNGGYGWVCTACLATINAHSWGLNSTYAVFLAYYLRNDVFAGATHLDYAFVGSLSIGVALLISPIATVMVREFGTRPTMLCGALLESLSLICASLSSRIWHLFLSQGTSPP